MLERQISGWLVWLFPSNVSLLASAARSVNRFAGGVATQGLQQDKLFAFDSLTGLPRPQLQLVAVPVRALVAPLSDAAVSKALSEAVTAHLVPLLPPGGLWPQDPALYHTTLWHASHHQVRPPYMSSTQIRSFLPCEVCMGLLGRCNTYSVAEAGYELKR